MPTTSLPSTLPSLSGWVATISVTTSTTEPLDSVITDDYVSSVAEIYGVDPTHVTATTVYSTSGTMHISPPSDVSKTQLEDTISFSIAERRGLGGREH